MSYESNEDRHQQTAASLHRLANLIGQIPSLAPITQKARARVQQVEEDCFTVLVVGSFSRGKSTLLNAMLGREILPQEVIPSTAVITVLTYADTPSVIIHFKDETPDETLTVEQFKDRYVLSPVEEDHSEIGDDGMPDFTPLSEEEQARMAADRFSHVDYAELRYPVALAKNRVQLVDSPGSEDDSARTLRARDFVAKADAIIYLLDATQPVTEHDLQHLRWIVGQGKTDIFFLANKWDVAEKMTKRDPDKLNRITLRFQRLLMEFTTIGGEDKYAQRTFCISALSAVEAREARPVDEAKLATSNIPIFEQALEKFLTNDRAHARNHALRADAGNYVRSLDESIKATLASQEKTIVELEGTKALIAPKLDQLRRIREHVREYLGSRVQKIHDDLTQSLRDHMSNVDTQKEVFETFDLSVLDGWLALKALKDLLSSEEDKFENRVKRALEPQIRKLLSREKDAWENQSASVGMRSESHSLLDFLKREAKEYSQIISEIEVAQGIKHHEPIPVNELITRWLEASVIEKNHVVFATINAGDVALDLGPLLGGLAAEVMLHLHGATVPILGTIVTVCLSVWRNSKQINKIKEGIAEGLRKSLKEVPTPAQSHEFKEQLQKRLDELSERVTSNMDEEIALIEANLDDAITRLKQGHEDAAIVRQKLDKLRSDARIELAEIGRLCA